MSQRKALKLVHLGSTAWFMVCVGYILIIALHQAGVNWWVVFSLSGYGALIVFLLVSLYLFAFFRGISRSQKEQVEHPLTTTTCYIAFYVIVPFLGGLAGCLGMIGVSTISRFLLGVALGTFGTTFLVWVIVDPVTELLEMLLPESRRHRCCRLAQAKVQREQSQKSRERLLEEVLAKEELDRQRWREILKTRAEKLAGLLTTDEIGFKQAEREAVDIGVNAWRMGGLSCMQELRDMAVALCRQSHHNETIVDYIPVWWDGIGNWRNPSIREINF